MNKRVLLMVWLIPGIGFAQPYSMEWCKVTDGGGTSGNGQYFLSSTIGQQVAGGAMTGGNYSVTGGFWSVVNVLGPNLAPIAPTLTWTNPSAVVYGTALGGSQLNATASVPGTFAYNPAAGAVLNAGSHILSAVFTPNNLLAYNSATTSVTQVVTPAPLSVTANNASKVYGAGLPTFTASYSGFVNGDTAASLTTPVTLSTTATSSSTVGAYTITASGAADANYTITQVNGTLSVTAAPLTITANNATRVYGQSNPSFTASYSGFVNGDGIGVLGGSPSLSTSANSSSTVAGSPYAIVVTNGTLSAGNYTFNFNNGQLTITPASTANLVSSSANPSPTGSNVTFTATLTALAPGQGTPTGAVQFLADGVSLGSAVALVGGTASLSTTSLSHGTHTISDQYAGDGNFLGSTNSLSPNQSIISPPIAANAVVQRHGSGGTKVRVAALMAGDSDPDHGVLTFVSAGPTSTNGGTVGVNGIWIFYTPPTGSTIADAFSYVIADSGGLQATGLVSILVPVDTSQSQNIVAVEDLGHGVSLIQFQGIPGRTYTIQFTPSLQAPVWQTLGTSTADATGAFAFTDTGGGGSGGRFYRSTYP